MSERRTYRIPGAAAEASTHRGYALWAPLYDGEENPLFEVEEPVVAEILQDLPYSRVLDAASGTGRYALRLAARGIEVTAVDQSAEMMEISRAHADREGLDVRHVLASIEQLPLASQRFDLVLYALALCHLDDLTRVMREFYRTLLPGGHVAVTDFHPQSVARGLRTEFSREGMTFYLPNRPHSRADYLRAMTDAGFAVRRTVDVPMGRAIDEQLHPRLVEYLGKDWRDVGLCLIAVGERT